ncbi:glycosyltransferase family 2 protein [Rubrivirga sp. IMCC45206]|uniref:glycosyltransferase family 2 protein n=1 Tax=Rubrivirga sp. IMCC45206 TaxID=3391614 RepID=UPI0039903274
MSPTITIAVCTRDRAEILGEALAALLAEVEGGAGVEVLVVDNGSTDGTAALLAGVEGVRAVREPVPGLSAARNRALAASDADWIVYLDDDAFVWPGWLAALREAIAHDGVVLAGGPIEPRFPTPPPAWFDPASVRRTFGPEGPLPDAAARRGFSGGNLAVRRDALAAVGGFDPALGMVAGRLGLGEETELAGRLVDRFGNATWHAPAMGVDHLEPAWKQRPGYVARRAFVNGRQAWRYADGGRGRQAGFSALKAGKQTAQGLARLAGAVVRPRLLHGAIRGLATGAGAAVGVARALRG